MRQTVDTLTWRLTDLLHGVQPLRPQELSCHNVVINVGLQIEVRVKEKLFLIIIVIIFISKITLIQIIECEEKK